MNKLLVSDILNLDDGTYLLEFTSLRSKLIIKGNVTLYIINSNINYLDIEIKEESNINIYHYNKNNNLLINIYQTNNSSINYNESFINNNDTLLEINNYIDGNNNKSNIIVRNISNKGNSTIISNLFIKENTINNDAIEDLKGITNGGLIHIEPNIVASSNEVIANHYTTIGSLDINSINYLLSKGINIDDATKLLLNGFKYSNMDNYIKSFGGEDNE